MREQPKTYKVKATQSFDMGGKNVKAGKVLEVNAGDRQHLLGRNLVELVKPAPAKPGAKTKD